MTDKIFEIKIVDVKNIISEKARRKVFEKVEEEKRKNPEFDFKGFARVTYVTASPCKIASVEPIEGTMMDYFKEEEDIAVF